jgi:cysteine dioxygenase
VLIDLLSEFDRYQDSIPLFALKRRLRHLKLELKDVKRWLCYSPRCYQRNLIHAGPAYEALLLCWRSGQRSPIHDHRNSGCVLKIIQGSAIETVFDRGPNGMVYPIRSKEMKQGSIVATYDEDIHQISNLQARAAGLVTLHVYSPPLRDMRIFTLDAPMPTTTRQSPRRIASATA